MSLPTLSLHQMDHALACDQWLRDLHTEGDLGGLLGPSVSPKAVILQDNPGEAGGHPELYFISEFGPPYIVPIVVTMVDGQWIIE